MNIKREVNLSKLIEKKSHFLWGPRQTGKTWLIREQLPGIKFLNLLESDTFAEYSARPALLRERTEPDSTVVIDEIQKLPVLLDEVHLLIEEKNVKFLLTGSSARKLRRAGNNLLGGRARSRQLLPLCSNELAEHFDLDTALNRGLLPSIYFSDEPDDDLQSYVGTYLAQEIAAEAAVRNLSAFSRFLNVVGHYNSKQVNYEKLALDSQVSPSTVRNYFQILLDTMLGNVLLPWQGKGRLREVSIAKFYFFDTGLARKLQARQTLTKGSPEYGDAFEAFIHHELRCYQAYRARDSLLNFWRTHSGSEVDFIINGKIAIEVKSQNLVSRNDLKGLLAFKKEYEPIRSLIVSNESTRRVVENIEILPWRFFLSQLWQGEIF